MQDGWFGDKLVFFGSIKKQLKQSNFTGITLLLNQKQSEFLLHLWSYSLNYVCGLCKTAFFFLTIKTLFIFCLWINNPSTNPRLQGIIFQDNFTWMLGVFVRVVIMYQGTLIWRLGVLCAGLMIWWKLCFFWIHKKINRQMQPMHFYFEPENN